MGLVRTALIFGAGFALGHPAGRAKLADLLDRPEVAEVRRKAVAATSRAGDVVKAPLAQTDAPAPTPGPATAPAGSSRPSPSVRPSSSATG